MKTPFKSLLLLTIVGLAVLAAGALYFGAPLFGWIIMIAIVVVFLVDQIRGLACVKKIAAEAENIKACEGRGFHAASGDGVVAERIKLAKKLMGNGIRLDSPIAFDVLSANAGIAVPRSSGSTVILLGLMGTFFGLMFSVATAGGAMDNSTTQGTLDTIQVLFQNMKGIFGTSLCGLFAALVLNASRGLLLNCRDEFNARLDSLTLDMQGEVTAADADKSEIEKLFSTVSENLTRMVSSVQQELVSMAAKVGEKVDTIPAKLQSGLEGVQTQLGGISASVQQSLGGVGSAVQQSLSGVGDAVKQSLSGVGGEIAASVETQVKQSNEQWKSFMDHLAAESTASVESQKQGLEALKNVALQVAEKAQAGSAELSQSVAEKLSTLSNDILAAFQKLSDTSAVLLEAQKTLTESIDSRVVKEKESADALGGNLVETAEMMRVNQSELSANLEMLRSALETILEKLSGDTAEHEDEDNFVEHLNQSLEAFHERASEVLMENAVKTQEILLEVMEQIQRVAISNQAPKAEG